MSWINSLAPWQWAVMLAVPPLIVLLYFLKLKRSPLVVPSTYLWKRTIEDMQVNSLWQRLRKSLLLLLQLLFVLALIIACLRPGFRSTQNIQSRRIFLLDTSASMQATDVKPTRFDAARRAISEQIDAMGSNDAVMLIAFSNRADVRQGFTSDRARLRAALDSTTVTNRTSDIGEALRAAAGLANPGRSSFNDMTDLQVAEAMPATVEIYSDGRFANIDEFNVGNLSPKFIAIGTAEASNVGIVAFSMERSLDKSGAAEAYGRIQNASPEPQTLTVELRQDERLLDAAELEMGPNETRGVSFRLPDPLTGVPYRLSIDSSDALSLDNFATTVLRPDRRLEVLVVSDGGQAIKTAFSTSVVAELARTTFVASDQYQRWSDANFQSLGQVDSTFDRVFDLVLFDSVPVNQLPPANSFVFGGSMSDATLWKTGPDVGPVLIVDWDRSSEILQYATMSNVRIAQGHNVEGPEGSRVLMRADNGPLMVTAPRGPFLDAVLGFGLTAQMDGKSVVNSDWPLKRSFPVFLLSLMQNLGGSTNRLANQSIRPGEPALVSVPTNINDVQIVNPSGTVQSVDRDSTGQIVFTATDPTGLYRVISSEKSDALLDAFVVNLSSAEETNIAAVNNLALGYQDVVSTAPSKPIRREYWRWLLGLGLMLLVAEWAVFSRLVWV